MFIVYKTTNLITKEYYIGNHKVEDNEEEFYGTGRFIRQSIKKYGTDNLKFEVLKQFDTREDAKKYAKSLIKLKPTKSIIANISSRL